MSTLVAMLFNIRNASIYEHYIYKPNNNIYEHYIYIFSLSTLFFSKSAILYDFVNPVDNLSSILTTM